MNLYIRKADGTSHRFSNVTGVQTKGNEITVMSEGGKPASFHRGDCRELVIHGLNS